MWNCNQFPPFTTVDCNVLCSCRVWRSFIHNLTSGFLWLTATSYTFRFVLHIFFAQSFSSFPFLIHVRTIATSLTVALQSNRQELSSCWDGRPFGHNRHGPKVGRAAVGSWVPTGSPSNTMWPGPRPTTLPSGILIHPTVWPQYTNVTDRTDRTWQTDNGLIA